MPPLARRAMPPKMRGGMQRATPLPMKPRPTAPASSGGIRDAMMRPEDYAARAGTMPPKMRPPGGELNTMPIPSGIPMKQKPISAVTGPPNPQLLDQMKRQYSQQRDEKQASMQEAAKRRLSQMYGGMRKGRPNLGQGGFRGV